MKFGILTMAVGIIISLVAAYYSITGLTAIFAAAVVPIIVMGAALEIGKVVAAVWLKLNWSRASWTYKLYLVPAVAFLMMLTSMGIFGFLSKAHSDQSLVSGDVAAKIAIYDEKIKISKENIDANRRALKQMDEAVDQVMGRSQDEKGADKAVALRRSQAKERTRLLSEITAEQKTIAQLSEERAPIAAEVRKVEAEVGPIKYIAALVYGDNPDVTLLESAVRWVIILIVIVFDPLALVLILAAQQSLRWAQEERTDEKINDNVVNEAVIESVIEEPTVGVDDPGVAEFFKQAHETAEALDRGDYTPPDTEKSIFEQHPYLNKPFDHFVNLKPMVAKAEPPVAKPFYSNGWAFGGTPSSPLSKPEPKTDPAPVVDDHAESPERPGDYIESAPVVNRVPETAQPHKAPAPVVPATLDVKKQQAAVVADNAPAADVHAGFGTSFPAQASKGDTFLRVDHLPNRLYKFNGIKWIEIDRTASETYVNSKGYIEFLVEHLQSGEYDVDQLTAREQDLVEEYLKEKNGNNKT